MRLELVQQDQVNLEKISAAAAAGPVQGEDVLIKGDQQEKIKDVYKVKGHAVLFYKDTILHADYGTYDRATGEVIAT